MKTTLLTCVHCAREFAPEALPKAAERTCSYHPLAPLIYANTGPRGDYADVWRFPCCGASVVGEIRDGEDIQPPQSPGCTLGEHLLRVIDVIGQQAVPNGSSKHAHPVSGQPARTPTAYRGTDPDLFVSYSHADSQCVFPEIHFLNTKGMRIWYDEGIDPGTVWMESLATAIDHAKVLLFYVTPRSVSSKHCRNEVNYALNADKQVLPVHLEPTELPKCLLLSLASIQAILRYCLDSAAYSERLTKAIGALMAEQSDARETSAQSVLKSESTPRSP